MPGIPKELQLDLREYGRLQGADPEAFWELFNKYSVKYLSYPEDDKPATFHDALVRLANAQELSPNAQRMLVDIVRKQFDLQFQPDPKAAWVARPAKIFAPVRAPEPALSQPPGPQPALGSREFASAYAGAAIRALGPSGELGSMYGVLQAVNGGMDPLDPQVREERLARLPDRAARHLIGILDPLAANRTGVAEIIVKLREGRWSELDEEGIGQALGASGPGALDEEGLEFVLTVMGLLRRASGGARVQASVQPPLPIVSPVAAPAVAVTAVPPPELSLRGRDHDIGMALKNILGNEADALTVFSDEVRKALNGKSHHLQAWTILEGLLRQGQWADADLEKAIRMIDAIYDHVNERQMRLGAHLQAIGKELAKRLYSGAPRVPAYVEGKIRGAARPSEAPAGSAADLRLPLQSVSFGATESPSKGETLKNSAMSLWGSHPARSPLMAFSAAVFSLADYGSAAPRLVLDPGGSNHFDARFRSTRGLNDLHAARTRSALSGRPTRVGRGLHGASWNNRLFRARF